MFQSILMREFKYNPLKHNVIDVREEFEFSLSSMPQAINIPLHTLPNHLDKLDKEKQYYIVCQSGSRSYAASQHLAQNGFKVVNVLGGMSAYRK